MGIKVEFNPDLALRNYDEFKIGNRQLEECIPESLEVGEKYHFLKKGQRNYWLFGEIPLLETKGNESLSDPIASIIIISATHFLRDGEIYTKGEYEVTQVFNDGAVNFNGFKKI